jgi:hypothetical protein
VLKGKQILQALCKCGWDEVIPEEPSISWKRWLSELDQTEETSSTVKPEKESSHKN